MNKENILETARFVYRGYSNSSLEFWQCVSLVDRYEKNIIIIKEKGKIKGVSFYLLIDDIALLRLKTFVWKSNNHNDFKELIARKGNNLHFLGVVADGPSIILKGLKKLIKKYNPKTVSWFKQDYLNLRMIKGGDKSG